MSSDPVSTLANISSRRAHVGPDTPFESGDINQNSKDI